jgi:hypothetical protein
MAAQPGSHSLGQAALRIRRCASAQRQLAQALRTLALLRAKAPDGLTPREAARLHPEDEVSRPLV